MYKDLYVILHAKNELPLLYPGCCICILATRFLEGTQCEAIHHPVKIPCKRLACVRGLLIVNTPCTTGSNFKIYTVFCSCQLCTNGLVMDTIHCPFPGAITHLQHANTVLQISTIFVTSTT